MPVFTERILIVDDQDCNLRLLEYALQRGGYTAVTSTTDPLEVSDLHRQNRYDLILLDLQMPRMNGFEVMKRLGDLEGHAKVPILVLTADPAQMVPALQAGAAGFLSKPFVVSEVLKRVRLMLEQSVGLSSLAHSVIDGR
jgi:DNA-binding response OmpR family regulator